MWLNSVFMGRIWVLVFSLKSLSTFLYIMDVFIFVLFLFKSFKYFCTQTLSWQIAICFLLYFLYINLLMLLLQCCEISLVCRYLLLNFWFLINMYFSCGLVNSNGLILIAFLLVSFVIFVFIFLLFLLVLCRLI